MPPEQYIDLHEAREQVTEQVLSADTLPEIEAAKQILREWIQAYPEEQGMRDGFELLYNLQEIIEAQDAEQACSSREQVGAGQATEPDPALEVPGYGSAKCPYGTKETLVLGSPRLRRQTFCFAIAPVFQTGVRYV